MDFGCVQKRIRPKSDPGARTENAHAVEGKRTAGHQPLGDEIDDMPLSHKHRGERWNGCSPMNFLLERTTQFGAFDRGGITLPKAVGDMTRTSVPASTVEMEDLVHDLPLAIQFQQREHVRKA